MKPCRARSACGRIPVQRLIFQKIWKAREAKAKKAKRRTVDDFALQSQQLISLLRWLKLSWQHLERCVVTCCIRRSMLQLHFHSGSLETSECAPIFADVLKRRLAAGLWLHFHIIHIPVEVQLVHKDCRNFFCLAHYRTLGRNLSNRENDQI